MLRHIRRVQSRDPSLDTSQSTASIIVSSLDQKYKENPDFSVRISGDAIDHPMGHPGIQSRNEQGRAPIRVEQNIASCGRQINPARQGQADEKLFQDDSGFERASSFEIEIGLKEPGWKLVDPAWSEVGMLSPGLVHGERGMPASPARFVEVHARGSEPAGVVEFQQVRSSSPPAVATGFHRRPAGCRGARGRADPARPSPRPEPSRSSRPGRRQRVGDVLAIDSFRIAGVDRQLLDLGRQDSRLGADQLHQETRRVGIELGVDPASSPVGSASRRAHSREGPNSRSPGQSCRRASPASWSPAIASTGTAGFPTR